MSAMTMPGTCQFYGCTEDNACMTEDGPCVWMDEYRTVCSNPECIAKAIDEAVRLVGCEALDPIRDGGAALATTGLERSFREERRQEAAFA